MFSVFLPSTTEDIQERLDDILAFIHKMSPDPGNDGFLKWVLDNPHALYFFYDDDAIIGFIRLDDRAVDASMGRNTVELHGNFLPDYQALLIETAELVMRAAFQKKKNIITKITPDNQEALDFCDYWGFRKINIEKGKDVYRLKRSEFYGLV